MSRELSLTKSTSSLASNGLVGWPVPANANFMRSMSWTAASRLPSTRSASIATASRLVLMPAILSRALSQAGSSSRLRGQTLTSRAFAVSLLNHLVEVAALSSFGPRIMTAISSFGLSTNCCSAFFPSSSGFAEANRSSMIRLSANKERLLASCRKLSQSKFLST